MPTLKQIAISELRNATRDYIEASANIGNDNARFVVASVRLHIARGADIPRAYVRESRRATKAIA